MEHTENFNFDKVKELTNFCMKNNSVTELWVSKQMYKRFKKKELLVTFEVYLTSFVQDDVEEDTLIATFKTEAEADSYVLRVYTWLKDDVEIKNKNIMVKYNC